MRSGAGRSTTADYRYLVIGPDQRTQSRSPIEAVWTGTDPAATKIDSEEDVFVFRLDGNLDPVGCAQLSGAGTGGGSLGNAAAPQRQ